MMDSDFLYLVEAELANAREKDPAPIRTAEQACGIIRQGAVRLTNGALEHVSDGEALRELVRIAAMCYRAAEDLQLLEVRPEPEPEPHKWCQEHKGKRFRADDPNQEKLGMAVNYKCLHGVEWVITGACLDALRPDQFESSCDCNPPRHAKLKRLDIVDDRRIEQKTEDGDLQPDEEFCGVDHCRHSIRSHGLFNGCKVKDCACWQFCRLEVQIASQR
jgi:hypothetical protein